MVSYPQVYPQNCGLVDNFVDNPVFRKFNQIGKK